jgi:hypothetical protein
MQFINLLLIVFTLSQTTPLKPRDEFEVKLNYEFRQRPGQSASKVRFDETEEEHNRNSSMAVLPYLKLSINILTSAGAVKAKFHNNKNENLQSRKVKDGVILPLDIGYTDDAKDRVAAHEYTITFIGEDKNEISKIVIFIDKDGSFLVNGEKRGKF